MELIGVQLAKKNISYYSEQRQEDDNVQMQVYVPEEPEGEEENELLTNYARNVPISGYNGELID